MASEKEISDLLKLMTEKNMKIEELKSLITEAASYNKRLSELELYCNANEQYNRNWSVRVFGVEVPESLILSHGIDGACMIHVYNKIILPVLSKKLDSVPECFDLLSNGHFVGAGKGNHPRTIIIRFRSRYFRNLFLRSKFEHLPTPTSAEVAKGISYFGVYPDLTSKNHSYLMALKRDPRTKSCWAFDGSLRFVLEGDTSNNVFFIQDINISPEENINIAVNSCHRRSRSMSPPSKRQTRASTGRDKNGQERPKSQDIGPGRFNQRGRGGRNIRNSRDGGRGGRGQARGGRGQVRGGRGHVRGGRYHQGAVMNDKQEVDKPQVAKYPEHTGSSQQAGPSGSEQGNVAGQIQDDQAKLPDMNNRFSILSIDN